MNLGPARMAQLVAAELRKIATLPATLAAFAVMAFGVIGLTLLNAFGVRADLDSGRSDALGYTSPVEAVFSAVPLGTVGAVILAVVAISSEYTANSPDAGVGRQISTTMTATPNRLALLAAKALVVILLVPASAIAIIPGCLGLAGLIIGDLGPPVDRQEALARALGATLYWTLTGLMALAITVLTRSGIVPLIVLITNSSLVSVSLLLTKLTSLAYWLPDVAGMRLFAGSDTWDLFSDALAPLPGGLVMTAWTAGLLMLCAVVFSRRDA